MTHRWLVTVWFRGEQDVYEAWQGVVEGDDAYLARREAARVVPREIALSPLRTRTEVEPIL